MTKPKSPSATVIGASSNSIQNIVQEKIDAEERKLGRPITHDEMSKLLVDISQDVFD